MTPQLNIENVLNTNCLKVAETIQEKKYHKVGIYTISFRVCLVKTKNKFLVNFDFVQIFRIGSLCRKTFINMYK